MFINYFKIISSICGCKGTNILNNVQYLKIMKMRMLAVFSLKIFGNFKFSPYLCTQYQKILGVDWI